MSGQTVRKLLVVGTLVSLGCSFASDQPTEQLAEKKHALDVGCLRSDSAVSNTVTAANYAPTIRNYPTRRSVRIPATVATSANFPVPARFSVLPNIEVKFQSEFGGGTFVNHAICTYQKTSTSGSTTAPLVSCTNGLVANDAVSVSRISVGVASTGYPTTTSWQTTATIREAFLDDGNPCTVDTCNATTGVTHTLDMTKPACAAGPEPRVEVDLSIASSVADDADALFLTQGGWGSLNRARAAIVRGGVFETNPSLQPVVSSGAIVSVLRHPEWGTRMTRPDGSFEIAVEAGERLSLVYQKPGFLPAQRSVEPRVNEIRVAPEVQLVAHDDPGTVLSANAPTMQVARGRQVTTLDDSDGARRATLLIPSGTTATNLASATWTMRLTEFTVGPNGPRRMPAPLPPSSAYTYAFAADIEEAATEGVPRVEFSQPVSFYVEDFPNFPTGTKAPLGFFDEARGEWVPEDSGIVAKVISISGGQANLSFVGSEAVATAAEYSNWGVTTEERQKLATLYAAGTKLMRVRLSHFSIWDINWNRFPPPHGEPPRTPKPRVNNPVPDSCTAMGSIIGCQDQTLGEEVPLVGTPHTLRYASNRQRGYKTTIRVPLVGPTTFTGGQAPLRIDWRVFVAGREFSGSEPPSTGFPANMFVDVTWDGKDAFNRFVRGEVEASVEVGNVYASTFQATERFGYAGLGGVAAITGSRSNGEITFWKRDVVLVGNFDARGFGFGGWLIKAHHAFEPQTGVVQFGDGRRLVVGDSGYIVDTVPMSGALLVSGDCGSTGICSDLATGPDGSVWTTSVKGSVLRRTPDGNVSSITGHSPLETNLYDGMPAANVGIGFPLARTNPKTGELYVVERPLSDTISKHRVWRITNDAAPVLRLVAGNGSTTLPACVNGAAQSCGDGGLAVDASLSFPHELAFDPTGNLLIADEGHRRVRRVTPDGRISSIYASTTKAPQALGVTPRGDVYIQYQGTASKDIDLLGAEGVLRASVVVDSRTSVCSSFDEGWMFISPEGQLGFSCKTFLQISRELPLFQRLAGIGFPGSGGNYGPAVNATFEEIQGYGYTPNGDLFIVQGSGAQIVRRLRPNRLAIQRTTTGFRLASPDGDEVYEFDHLGKHLRTASALTGATLWQFGYDAGGRMVSVWDGVGLTTNINRGANGEVLSVSGPYGQTTAFGLDANGLLQSATNPNGEIWTFNSASDGLMQQAVDPRSGNHYFGWSADGRLTYDADPAGHAQTLGRANSPTGFEVTLTSGEGRKRKYAINYAVTEDETRTFVTPGGVTTTQQRLVSGVRTTSASDTSVHTITRSIDPRWGMAAPLVSTNDVSSNTGTARRHETRTTSTASLAVADDPYSVTNLTMTRTQNLATCGNGVGGCITSASTTTFNRAASSVTHTTDEGRVSTVYLDSLDRVYEAAAPGVAPMYTYYDGLGRPYYYLQGSRGLVVNYASDGTVASITDPAGRVATFTRDPVGRPLTVQYPGLQPIAMTYDAMGNRTSVTPPGGSAHVMSFDIRNLASGYTPPSVGGATNTSYAFDKDRLLTTTTTPLGALTRSYGSTSGLLTGVAGDQPRTYTRLADERVSQVVAGGSDNITLGFTYDGRLPTVSTWSGAGMPYGQSLSTSYDHHMQVSGLSMTQNGSTTAVAYSRDRDDLITQATGAGSAVVLGRNAANGRVETVTVGNIVETRTFDATYGELESLAYTYLGSPLYSVNYVRDALLGRVTQRTETRNGVVTVSSYTYDYAGRLTGVDVDGVVTTWDYDDRGNRIVLNGTTVGVVDAQDRMSSYAALSFAHDSAGNRTSRTLGGVTTNYAWDRAGNMRSATTAGAGPTYRYDGQERRVARVNAAPNRSWLYDGQLRIVGENAGTPKTFVYASRANVPDTMVTGGQTYRLITDQLGSVQMVVNANTGAIEQSVSYDAWGNVTLLSGTFMQPFGFAGGVYDASTKLVRFGAREYDPEVGRWVSKDPSRFAGGWNLYAYCYGDPVNYVDVDGRIPVLVAAVLILGTALVIAVALDIYFLPMRDAEQTKLPGPYQGKQDAYRHCLASCVATSHFSEGFAKFCGDANEDNPPDDDAKMDLANNATGRGYGSSFSVADGVDGCRAACRRGVDNGELQLHP